MSSVHFNSGNDFESASRFIETKHDENEQRIAQTRREIEQRYQQERAGVETAHQEQQALHGQEWKRLGQAVNHHDGYLAQQQNDFEVDMHKQQQQAELRRQEHEQEMLLRQRTFQLEIERQQKELEALKNSIPVSQGLKTDVDPLPSRVTGDSNFGKDFGSDFGKDPSDSEEERCILS